MIYEHYVVWGICLLVIVGIGVLAYSFLVPADGLQTHQMVELTDDQQLPQGVLTAPEVHDMVVKEQALKKIEDAETISVETEEL